MLHLSARYRCDQVHTLPTLPTGEKAPEQVWMRWGTLKDVS